MATLFSPWARIGTTPRLFPAGAILTPLVRRPGRIDLCGAGVDGGIWMVGWSETARGSGWGEWTRVGAAATINSPPNVGPVAVARGPRTVDLFAISANGTIWTTGGDPEEGLSPGWRQIGREMRFVPGTALTAVAPDADHVWLLALGNDGQVWVTRWTSAHDWADWTGIGPESLLATRRHHMLDTGRRARVAAVASAERCDVYAVDRGGRVRTVRFDGARWGSWQTIGEAGIFEREAQVTAVALDGATFLVAATREGGVLWTTGDPEAGFGDWHEVGARGLLGPGPRTAITALPRHGGEIELFVAGADGIVLTSAGSAVGGFPELSRIEGPLANVPAHSIVAAASPRPDRVDLLSVRTDGLVYGAVRRDGSVRVSIPPPPATLRTPSEPAGAETVVILGAQAGGRDASAAPDVLRELAELEALRTTADGVARRHALLVGVNAYVDPNLPALRFCENDVLALGEALRAAGYDSILTLHDGAPEAHLRPTRENIKVELLNLVETLKADDLVLVHFSCHGTLIGGRPHLLPANARTKILAESSLAVDEVARILAGSAARCMLVLLDACHTGADFGRDAAPSSLTPEFVHNVYELAQGMKVLAGATSQQVAKERDDAGRGAFTSFVIEALTRVDGWSPADHERKGFVSFDDLKNHVSNGVMDWSRRHGLDLQRPNETGAAAGSMIVADFRGRT